MNKKKWLLILLIAMLFLVLSACGNANEDTDKDANNIPSGEPENEDEALESIDVTLKNPDGDNVGTAELEQVDEGVKITIDATHLPPGLHGFHIHEKSSCEAPDFESAGGHFNPTDADHGMDRPEGPHAGDLPNIEVAEDGTVRDEVIAEMVTLEKGEANSLLGEEGTSLVIHSDEDDNKSQPAGDAGDRIVCGEITE